MLPFTHFFTLRPALFYAINLIIGLIAAFYACPALLALLLLLNLPFVIQRHWSIALIAICLGLIGLSLVHESIRFHPLPENGLQASVLIEPDQLSLKSSRYGKHWHYRGRIKEVIVDGKKLDFSNVPFTLLLSAKNKKPRPIADSSYWVAARITEGHGTRVNIKPSAKAVWEKVPGTFSFAEMRYSAKATITEWIKDHFSSQTAATFLAGLVIGEFDDQQLVQDFGRFGLLHLLAISGFHFSVFAALLGKIGRLFLWPRPLAFFLMLLLSGYFLLLGWGPSVLRAWMTILVFYGGALGERKSDALNSLGIALLLTLMIDPLLIENLGYQFSFATTAAILTLAKPGKILLEKAFPLRSHPEVRQWGFLTKCSYIFLCFIVSEAALGLATSLVALPITLYYFQLFPLLTLVYNVFFPFLVSISMGLLLIGLLLSPIPYLAGVIHLINDYFTSFILNLTFDVPQGWDWTLRIEGISGLWVIVWIIFIFGTYIYFQKSTNHLLLESEKI